MQKIRFSENGSEAPRMISQKIVLWPQRRVHFGRASFSCKMLVIIKSSFFLAKMGFWEHGSVALLMIIPKSVLWPQRGAYLCIAATYIGLQRP